MVMLPGQIIALDSAVASLSSLELATLSDQMMSSLGLVFSSVGENGAMDRDDLSRYTTGIVEGVRRNRFEEAGLWRNQLVEKVRGVLEGEKQTLIDLIKRELVNSDFDEGKRRNGHSIVRYPYRTILDPFFDSPYPLNALGTFCRIIPDYLESYVNIGRLIQRISEKKPAGPLGYFLSEATKDDSIYAYLRLAIREALHAIGDLSYAFEWRDPRTYRSLDTLLEGIAGYCENNRKMAERLKPKLVELFSSRSEVWVLDLGSGVGGTSIELFNLLNEMEAEGLVPSGYREKVHLVLFDISERQLGMAEEQIRERFGVAKIDKVLANFGDIENALRDYRGRIDIAISGAAICHVTKKGRFFKHLHDTMRSGSALSIWDPAVSVKQGDYLRVSPDDNIRIRYRYSVGYGDAEFVINRGEILPVGAVRMFADKKYETTVEVPYDEIVMWSADLVHMQMSQMGYSFPNISREEEERLKKKLQREMLEGVKTAPGFNLIRWYRENLIDDPKAPIIPTDQTTPYDLIEAFSDVTEYVNSLGSAGFVNLNHIRHRNPVAYDNDEEALKSVVVYFYAEKTQDST